MNNLEDPWERIRHYTLDQMITWTKKRGSAFGLSGHTTPEHWRFAFYIAIGSTPANEQAVEMVLDCARELERKGATAAKSINPNSMASEINWAQQTVHQAHHEGAADSCQRPACVSLRALVVRAGGLP